MQENVIRIRISIIRDRERVRVRVSEKWQSKQESKKASKQGLLKKVVNKIRRRRISVRISSSSRRLRQAMSMKRLWKEYDKARSGKERKGKHSKIGWNSLSLSLSLSLRLKKNKVNAVSRKKD